VVLKLDLPARVDRLLALPVVLQRHVVHDENVVQIDGDALADHEDAERVPLAGRAVGDVERLARVLLVVPQTAGAFRAVPDLHLRAAAEVDAAVALGLDLPVDEEVEVCVVAAGAEAVALAVEDERAVGDGPVGAHAGVGLFLRLGQLVGLHARAARRVGH